MSSWEKQRANLFHRTNIHDCRVTEILHVRGKLNDLRRRRIPTCPYRHLGDFWIHHANIATADHISDGLCIQRRSEFCKKMMRGFLPLRSMVLWVGVVLGGQVTF